MLATVRVLRVIAGLIAAWQILGLLPVLTTWLPNFGQVTGSMWAIALLKGLVFLIFGGIYVALGKVKRRLEKSGASSSEGRGVIYGVFGLLVVGIVLAIALPAISNRNQETDNSTAQQAPDAAPIQIEPPKEKTEAPACQDGKERNQQGICVPWWEAAGTPVQNASSSTENATPRFEKPPTFESQGWTQESTERKESGPWLTYDPPGTRYYRNADGIIFRVYPPGVRPNGEKANPFGLMESSDRPPQ